ncbi:MAG: hypothetical protein FWE33_05370 [Defluviitaleaceae bacterium]|nr:hypothetical protein [Defluviitaleaceae bacterium]
MRNLRLFFVVVLMVFFVACSDDVIENMVDDGNNFQTQDVVNDFDDEDMMLLDFDIQVVSATDNVLAGFENVHEFNFNDLRAVTDGLVGDFFGEWVVVFANVPITDFAIISVSDTWESGRHEPIVQYLFGDGIVLDVDDGFLIRNFVSYFDVPEVA